MGFYRKVKEFWAVRPWQNLSPPYITLLVTDSSTRTVGYCLWEMTEGQTFAEALPTPTTHHTYHHPLVCWTDGLGKWTFNSLCRSICSSKAFTRGQGEGQGTPGPWICLDLPGCNNWNLHWSLCEIYRYVSRSTLEPKSRIHPGPRDSGSRVDPETQGPGWIQRLRVQGGSRDSGSRVDPETLGSGWILEPESLDPP